MVEVRCGRGAGADPPELQADGGDVQLVDVSDDGVVTVELQGACKGCPMSPDDARQWRRAHPEGARARRYLRGAGDVINDGAVTRRCEFSAFIFTLVLHAALAEANLVQRQANLRVKLGGPIKRLFVEMRGWCMEGCWSRRGCDDEMRGAVRTTCRGSRARQTAITRRAIVDPCGVRGLRGASKPESRLRRGGQAGVPLRRAFQNGPDIDPETRTRDKFSGRKPVL